MRFISRTVPDHRDIIANLVMLLIPLLIMSGVAIAGVTGKVSGVITDSKTGEPVANANVVLIGTDYGAATSLDGDFYILNVRPGKYDITVTHVNYGSVTQQDLLIYTDLTATVNFELSSTTVQRDEVIIKAERPVVRADVTATTRLTTGDEMYNMPVGSYVGALASVGGAVGSGANIHIRGGRRGEVAYLVDGMEVKDPLNNLRMLQIGSPAVAEMVAQTGGFDAEFGNAQSAVINVVTREGGKNYKGRIKYVFDDISPRSDSKFETRDTYFDEFDTTITTQWQPPLSYQNYDALEASLGGPEPISTYLLPKLGLKVPGYVTFFGSTDITARNTSSNGLRISSSPWYRHDASGGLLPDAFGPRREHTFFTSNLQLTHHINPTMKLKVGYRFNREWYNPFVMRQSRHFPFDYTQDDVNAALQAWTGNDSTNSYVFDRWNPLGLNPDDDGDGRVDEEALNGKDDDLDGLVDEDIQWYEYNAADHTPMRKIYDDQFLLSWNQTLNEKTFFHIKLSRYYASRLITGADKNPDEYGEYAENFTDLPDANGKYNGMYDPGEPFMDSDGDGIWDSGNPSNNTYQYKGYAISGDGTDDNIGQPVPAWYQEKSYVYAAKFQLTSQVKRNHQIRAGIDFNYFDISNHVLPYPTIDNEGQGIYTDIYRVYPSDGALYVQDKMEFNDITLSIGGRLDFYMPGEQVRHVTAFDTFATDGSRNPEWSPNFIPFDIPEKFKATLSPRIGASFAITEQAYLHAHYGHFYQRPMWSNMFEGVNQPQTGGTPRIGNPDLDPEKTVSFEVGVSWNPYQNYLIDVTGFLKDVKNWINTRDGKDWYPEQFGNDLIGQNFAIYDNQDYAFARGMEFNFSREYGSNISGRVTYTLSWVHAKNSYNISTQAIRRNYVEPPLAIPAGWDQRHTIVTNFGLTYADDEPIFGIEGAPGGWNINMIWSINSGLPYSPTDASGTLIEGRYMTERTDWTDVINLNLTKYFNIYGWRTSLWLEVRNLLDSQNMLQADDNYVRVGTPQSFDCFTGEVGWVIDSVSPNYVQNPFAGPNPEAWDNPRFMRIGLGLEF